MTLRSSLVTIIGLLLFAGAVGAQSAADINVAGELRPDKTPKGRAVRAVIVVDIPNGLHIQSNRPLDKFLVPTKLDVEVPPGLQVGPVTYPRPVMRILPFSKQHVAVFESRTEIRFNITVPPNYSGGSADIKAKLRFQACNDESCFPPVTRNVTMHLTVK